MMICMTEGLVKFFLLDHLFFILVNYLLDYFFGYNNFKHSSVFFLKVFKNSGTIVINLIVKYCIMNSLGI